MNRLSRDFILIRALDMVDSPSLNEQDRPSGTIVATALSIGWLQDALDLFHNRFPWAGIVTSKAFNLAAGTDTYALPSTFIMDVRDGLLLTTTGKKRRVRRWSLQRFISAALHLDSQGQPERYVILPPNLRVWRTPDVAYSGTLWFYSLPVVLGAATVPNFPSDWALVEYVRLRGLEWLNKVEPGTAEAYANAKIGDLLRSGLQHEPEDDVITLDPDVYGARESAPWGWMGNVVA